MKKLILATLLLFGFSAQATIVSDRIAATNRLLPLKKITVGPDDQYQGSVDPSGTVLVYTFKTNLVPHLRVQELKTGEVRDFLPLTADSQEPSIGPGGEVSFTYFKFSSRGDICFAELPSFSKPANKDVKIRCLARSESEKSEARLNSFWKSNYEIGYIVENPTSKERSIVSENIQTGAKSILASGKLFSPAMKLGGSYLTYIQIFEEEINSKKVFRRELVLQDLQKQKKYVVHFSLPGISGFPAISSDGNMIYFSHYPNDSNGDNIIDGSDNAVVFRIPIAKIVTNESQAPLFPEQLTSLENSCSFPHPFQDVIYVTCAFEGSLDIYQMPATGIVPVKWTKAILINALATSRSYQERILNLNTEKYRDPSDLQITNERLLNNHILADETAAALSFLEEMIREKKNTAKQKEFFEILKIYLEAKQLKKSQPSADISRVFRGQMKQFENQLSNFHQEQNFKQIVHGLLNTFTNDFQQAAGALLKVQSVSGMRPLERYLYFELADVAYGHDLPRSEAKLLDAYHIMLTAPELDEEAHIFYSFRLLDRIEQLHKDLPSRIQAIESAKKFLLKPVLSLLDSETTVLRLLSAADAEKPKNYAELDRLMSESRDDYFLRKALYVRAILNFTNAAQFNYLELVATSWLKYTALNDTEFIYAREVVQSAALDQAYANVAIKNDNFASGFFYGSLSLTDDLESHYGYVQAMLHRNLRDTINDRYKNLIQRSFIDDNMKFVEALLILVDQAPKANADKTYTAHLDLAIEKLNAMSQDRDSAVRYLLLGSCYLDKLLRTANGLEFSSELMQNANRALMLAYDLGRDNSRIQAATLMNLGLLHSRVQNQALAVRFFSLRKLLGFVSPEEKSAFAWFYSRSLFLSHQPELAANEISEVEKANLNSALLERKAFYFLSAQRYKESKIAYDEFFKTSPKLDQISLAKIKLSYGFILLKNDQGIEAKKYLLESLKALEPLSSIGRGPERSIEFNPNRMRLFAYGFLAQIGEVAEKKAFLIKRLELLQKDSSITDDPTSAVIEVRLQIANLSLREPQVVGEQLREVIRLSEKLGKDTGYLAHGVFVAATASLIEGIVHPEIFSQADIGAIQSLVQNAIKTYENQKIAQSFLNYQNLKLKILSLAFSAKTGRRPLSQAEVSAVISTPLATGVKASLPKQWQEISSLSEAILSH